MIPRVSRKRKVNKNQEEISETKLLSDNQSLSESRSVLDFEAKIKAIKVSSNPKN